MPDEKSVIDLLEKYGSLKGTWFLILAGIITGTIGFAKGISILIFLAILMGAAAFIQPLWIRNKEKIFGWIEQRLPSIVSNQFLNFFFSKYYNKAIINTCSPLPLVTLGTTLHLEDAFVQLHVTFHYSSQSSKETSIWDFLCKDDTSRGRVLVLVGQSGSGKSTLLRHIALTLAKNPSKISRRQYHSRQGFRAYTPILLQLGNFPKDVSYTNLDSPSLGKLAQQIFCEEHRDNKPEMPDGWLEKRLRHGNCVVLLDGLDQVTEDIAKWVNQQVKAYPGCRFVVTTRPYGYSSEFFDTPQVLQVRPPNSVQRQAFAISWYQAYEKVISPKEESASLQQTADRNAKNLLRRIRDLPLPMKDNPLLLTLITGMLDESPDQVLPNAYTPKVIGNVVQ
ncbi:MAG: NACHT domain-containing protein [Ktedonobacteraceae bacterium]